jgi:hypothetical protein
MSIFACCEREDETKYFHTCECPSATFSCESETINATLCGFSETSGYASSPPRKYLKQSVFDSRGSGPGDCGDPQGDCCGDGYWSGTTVREYSPTGAACGGQSITSSPIQKYYQDGTQSNTFHASPFPCNSSATCGSTFINWLDPPPCTRRVNTTLFDEDTEDLAIARETPVTGASCSSLRETRSTGFSFIDRTSGYTIECSDLIVGLEYEVTPSIKKRTAVIGSYGEWEDVTVTPVTFTATATTKTIDNGGEPIPLDHIEGYEYKITGVNIEKKA